MQNLIIKNIRFLVFIFLSSLLLGILIEFLTKDLSKTNIYSSKANFFLDPVLPVYSATFDIYDSEMEQLLRFNSIQQNLQSVDLQKNNTPLISNEDISGVLYLKYSKKQLSIKNGDFFYKDNQVIGGSFSLLSKNINVDKEIASLISNLNNEIKQKILANFKIKKDIYIIKEKEAEKYITKQINRLKDSYLNVSYNNELNEKDIIESAYAEKIERIKKAFEYSKSNNFKSPLLSQINPNVDFLYLLGSDVLSSMLSELIDNKNFYISNPEFLYNNILPNLSTMIKLLNKLRNDLILDEFLLFYDEVYDYIINSETLINYEINNNKTTTSDIFKNLRFPGTITTIITTLGLLLGISFITLSRKN